MTAISQSAGPALLLDEIWLDLSHDKPIPRPSSGQSGRIVDRAPGSWDNDCGN